MTETSRAPAIPVTILTGFLGSGKTTLLKSMLADPEFADTAVIVNEFGEIGLDHDLIDAADETLIETTTGCLCCTVQGDVRRTVAALMRRAQDGACRPFSRIVVETTGLADPAPVLNTFLGAEHRPDEPDLSGVYLQGVVTLVDAIYGDATLDRFEEARRQAACADLVILTKTDAARDPASQWDLTALRKRIQALNDTAPIVDAHEDGVSPKAVFAPTPFDPSSKSADVLTWLKFGADHATSAADPGSAHQPQGHRHAHHHAHNANRHGDDIEAHCIAFDQPLASRGFWFALELLLAHHGARMLRLKGLVALDDDPDRPVLLHGVQHTLSPPVQLEGWPSEDRRTRLVVISQGAPAEDIRGAFALFEPPAPSA